MNLINSDKNSAATVQMSDGAEALESVPNGALGEFLVASAPRESNGRRWS
jgi:hypothetical protein